MNNKTRISASAFGGGAGGTAKSPTNVAAGGGGVTGGGGTGKAATGTATGGDSVRWQEDKCAKNFNAAGFMPKTHTHQINARH